MAGGPWDTEKDLRQIANLGLLEFMSQLARQGKEDDDPNPTVRNRQLPSRDVEVGPFIGPACGASSIGGIDSKRRICGHGGVAERQHGGGKVTAGE